MVLEKLKARRKEQGFTLVELLIVIVVIAILAAITIVAYGNVTAKAHDSGYQSDAASIVSLIEAFNADTGAYPTGATSGALTPTDTNATAKQPADIYIVATTAPVTATAVATTSCTTASNPSAWAACTSGNVTSYQVKFCTAGANVYYPVTAGTAAVKVATAGSGC